MYCALLLLCLYQPNHRMQKIKILFTKSLDPSLFDVFLFMEEQARKGNLKKQTPPTMQNWCDLTNLRVQGVRFYIDCYFNVNDHLSFLDSSTMYDRMMRTLKIIHNTLINLLTAERHS